MKKSYFIVLGIFIITILPSHILSIYLAKTHASIFISIDAISLLLVSLFIYKNYYQVEYKESRGFFGNKMAMGSYLILLALLSGHSYLSL